MKLLDNREAIHFLVKTFYTKVQADDLIGPIFNAQITDWETHFEQLTDFWESNLTLFKGYQGNPVKTHQQVDHHAGGIITSEHFGRWLLLWFETIDEHFTGDYANIAKNRARNMSTHLFMKIYSNRKK